MLGESGIDRYWREEREREEQEQRRETQRVWIRYDLWVDVTDNWDPLREPRPTRIQ